MLLELRSTVILTSRADLPLAEVVQRHRGKQRQENAQSGRLTEFGQHHPPREAYAANQVFYQCEQIEQLQLRPVQSQSLPVAAMNHRLRPLIRHFVQIVGRLTRNSRRLLFRKEIRAWTCGDTRQESLDSPDGTGGG